MIKVKINTFEVFVRIKTSKFGSTATSKVWIEAENHLMHEYKQRLCMDVIILLLIHVWLKDKTKAERDALIESFLKRHRKK